MRTKNLLLILICIFLTSTIVEATSITFTFANGQITGTSPKYYEFDVMAAAGASGTKLGDNLVMINYNTLGFGTSVSGNGKITVTKGTLIQGDVLGDPLYDIVNIADNTPSRVAIIVGYNYDSSPTWANDLPTTPTQLVHVSMEIADQNQTAGLSFEQSLMDGQQYESDNTTKYSPVIASDTDDSPLPVELANFSAQAMPFGVTLLWETKSEINNLGFEVWRSEDNRNYHLLASYKEDSELEGHGTISSGHSYKFTDISLSEPGTYYYKIVDVDYSGKKSSHGPLSVDWAPGSFSLATKRIPANFNLYRNYPNPFNPSTTIEFDVPAGDQNTHTVNIVVFNLLGKMVDKIFTGTLPAGNYRISWTAQSRNGQPLPSGIYFVALYSTNYSKTIKMTLVR